MLIDKSKADFKVINTDNGLKNHIQFHFSSLNSLTKITASAQMPRHTKYTRL